jgi:hypothetical protein
MNSIKPMPTNRYELFNAMVARTQVMGTTYVQNSPMSVVGTISAIELEDGSGHCFNVHVLSPNNRRYVCFVRG